MDNRFRWNMFVTSFLPLWVSIMIVNLWEIITNICEDWNIQESLWKNSCSIVKNNIFILFAILVIVFVVSLSIIEINCFIKGQRKRKDLPKAKVKKAVRANKLSSEFLLAYILPMIAFVFSDIKELILFLIYFSVLAFLCIRNNNVYTNIFLEFKGYKMYTCSLEYPIMNKNMLYEECLVISKENMISRIGKEIKYWDFDNYIYINLE